MHYLFDNNLQIRLSHRCPHHRQTSPQVRGSTPHIEKHLIHDLEIQTDTNIFHWRCFEIP